MRAIFSKLLSAVLIASLVLPSCGGGGDDPQPAEADLVITTNPPLNGQAEAVAPGPNFPLTVTVTSAMPPQGVRIEVTARPDGASSTAFFTANQTTSNSTTSFSITNTPQLQVCRVTVTVTSVSKPANSVTGFYLYSRK